MISIIYSMFECVLKCAKLKLCVCLDGLSTIWWCIWGWVGWRCCRPGIWWNRSCTCVLSDQTDVAERIHTMQTNASVHKRTTNGLKTRPPGAPKNPLSSHFNVIDSSLMCSCGNVCKTTNTHLNYKCRLPRFLQQDIKRAIMSNTDANKSLQCQNRYNRF